jgi:UDP-N-acetylglucosamine 4-epimerase
VGLRYFNVFGPRQDPAGPYAAVIPKWIQGLLSNDPCVVFGDGSASRDFCFVDNVVQANLLAACAPQAMLQQPVFNVGCGARTTLLELFDAIREGVLLYRPSAAKAVLRFEEPRIGDIPHSLASIARARAALGYAPSHDVSKGIAKTIGWYVARSMRSPRAGAHGGAHSPATNGAP